MIPRAQPQGELCVDALDAADYDEWLALWNANNMGQENAAVTAQTWDRICDKTSPVNGFCARENGAFAGFVHYILHPVTGSLNPACYMQDVYVDPAFRRRGIARTMIGRLAAEGMTQKWARIYWLAERNNVAAQKLYQDIGVKLDFTMHVLPL